MGKMGRIKQETRKRRIYQVKQGRKGKGKRMGGSEVRNHMTKTRIDIKDLIVYNFYLVLLVSLCITLGPDKSPYPYYTMHTDTLYSP
jgi:hypothetical protein